MIDRFELHTRREFGATGSVAGFLCLKLLFATRFVRPSAAMAACCLPIRTDDLAAIPIKALMERNAAVDWLAVDDVIFGCANQAGEDNRNVARMALLLAGLPQEVPGATVNRLCGSSMEAISMAARAIRCGEAELVIAGGVESMSRAPFVMAKADAAFSRSCQAGRHHTGMAVHQPDDERTLRRGLDGRDRRERGRGVSHLARRSGCVCLSQPAARSGGDQQRQRWRKRLSRSRFRSARVQRW